MADYYCCPVETAMRSVLPQVIRDAEVGDKKQLFARLVRPPTPEEVAALQKRAPRQAEVVQALQEAAGEPLQVATLAKSCGATHQTIQSLVKAGLVETTATSVARDPYEKETFVANSNQTLTAEQAEALRITDASMEAPKGEKKPVLLFGVTGSGKTEVYLQAIAHALERGQTALVLVPEISLTPQTVERFKSRFASTQEQVAVLHSHLSAGERHDEWHKIHGGKARIVIGARSAVFAPLSNLGLIVVDEEHENSYKQEEAPRYQARDLAVLRARMEDCAVVLGSATPSVESYHNAMTGKYELALLTMRVDDQKMPFIRIVDLRIESGRHKSGQPLVLSEKLRAAIGVRLEKKEQTILFLNRRGFATSLVCPGCGDVSRCVNCSVALTFHRAANRLVCHLCGHQAAVPNRCAKCNDPAIRQAGLGTERVEEVVGKVFPQANIRRMDADAMTKKESYRETLHAFRAGKIDILVGTQMIAKGLHFPNVTLVGIVNADLALHLPDFRAGERTFQLLTQVAGRAGRGEMTGEVFVQSFTPFSPVDPVRAAPRFRGVFPAGTGFPLEVRFPAVRASGVDHGALRAPGARPVHGGNDGPPTQGRVARRRADGRHRARAVGEVEGAVPLPASAARQVCVQAEPARPRGAGEDAIAPRRDRSGGRGPVPVALIAPRRRGGSRLLPAARRALADHGHHVFRPSGAFGRRNTAAQPRPPRPLNAAVHRLAVEKQFPVVAIHQVGESAAHESARDVERLVTKAGKLGVAHENAVAPGVRGEAVPFGFLARASQRPGGCTEARAGRV